MRCITGDLYLNDLDPAIYMELVDSLNENFAWKKLIEHMELPPDYISRLLRAINSYGGRDGQKEAEILLQRLDARMVPIRNLVEWLEAANLFRPLLLLKADEPLEIIRQPPSSASVFEGYPLILSCQANSFPPPEYQWFRDEEELLLQQEKELVIKNTRQEHSGFYYCRVRAFHSSGPSECETGLCCVTVVPPFKERENPRRKKMLVQCIPESDEDSSQTKEMSSSDNMSPIDSSMDSNLEEKCDIEILKQPVSHENVRQGSIIILKCEASSKYPLKYQWYCDSDGCPIKGEINSELRLENLFTDAHTKQMKRKYYCKIANQKHHRFTDVVTVELRPSDELTCFQPEEKVALLIANEFCGSSGPLSNLKKDKFSLISNDVVTVRNLLRALGFKTISLKNLNCVEMKNAIDRYCETLGPNKYGFIYVAGHGLQLCKQTYLMPTDCATIFEGFSSEQISSMTVCTDCILSKMQDKKPDLIVQMFDVCRNTPQGAEKIVPEKCCQAEVKGNTFRCYATSSFCAVHESDKESNGYFVKHLQEIMKKSSRAQLEDILKGIQVEFKRDPNVHESQCPTTESSLNEFRTLGDRVIEKGNSVFNEKFAWTDCKGTVFKDEGFVIEFLSNCESSTSLPVVMLQFYHHRKTFCNSMDVLVLIDIPSDADLNEVRQLDIELEFGDFECITKKFDYECELDSTPIVSSVEVQNLQRLIGDLTGKITVKNRKTGFQLLQEDFSLGQHPISKMKLSTPNKSNNK